MRSPLSLLLSRVTHPKSLSRSPQRCAPEPSQLRSPLQTRSRASRSKGPNPAHSIRDTPPYPPGYGKRASACPAGCRSPAAPGCAAQPRPRRPPPPPAATTTAPRPPPFSRRRGASWETGGGKESANGLQAQRPGHPISDGQLPAGNGKEQSCHVTPPAQGWGAAGNGGGRPAARRPPSVR